MMTEEQLKEAIAETERQEKLFMIAEDHLDAAWWVCERIKLREQLYRLLWSKVR